MKYAFTLFLSVWLCACSTVVTKVEHSQWGEPYSGTKDSPESTRYYLGASTRHAPAVVIVVISGIFDFLASFAADTALLPADLVISAADKMDGDNEEGEEANKAEEDSDKSSGQIAAPKRKRWI